VCGWSRRIAALIPVGFCALGFLGAVVLGLRDDAVCVRTPLPRLLLARAPVLLVHVNGQAKRFVRHMHEAHIASGALHHDNHGS